MQPQPRVRAPRYQPGGVCSSGASLASNESPLGPSPTATAAWRQGDLRRYPESSAQALRERLAAHHGIDAQSVVCGHGAEEVISLLLRAHLGPGDELVVPELAFCWYGMVASAIGADTTQVPLGPELVERLVAACGPQTRVLALANPNNPTGAWLDADSLRSLRRALPPHVLLLIDEAYAEFAQSPWETALPMAQERVDAVVVRTFSKAYGLAGARVGWCLAPPSTVSAMHALRGPFNTSSSAVAAACAALKDQAWLTRTVQHVRQERQWLSTALSKAGIDFLPSMGNFLMVSLRDEAEAKRLLSGAASRGLRLRPLAAYGRADAVRITVGTRAQHEELLKVCRSLR